MSPTGEGAVKLTVDGYLHTEGRWTAFLVELHNGQDRQRADILIK